ncbi:hypothetical protein IKF04_03250 [Candidatus Saccharibacteria bacterium]|nr:hypothetical protein [Candidatus Saccharibacteria bacterium]
MQNNSLSSTINPIAHNSLTTLWLESSRGMGAVVRAKNIKENTRYMRIKRLKRPSGHKKSNFTPAEWFEYIEI